MIDADRATGGATGGAASPGGAGRLLREAREAQGLSLDMLATTIKVKASKLELLESEHFDKLPDATFARALAQTMCRALKIDAVPVLALLPPASGHRIEMVSEGLNAPFRDHPSRLDPMAWISIARSLWAPALVLALAALLYFLPNGFMQSTASTVREAIDSFKTSRAADAPSAEVAGMPPGEPAASASPVLVPQGDVPATGIPATVATAPVAPAVSTEPTRLVPAPGAGALELRARSESWVEVKDGRDRVLLSRSLKPNETVTLDGVMPMRVKIGNAAVTELRYRGELIDLAPMTNENIARVQLK
ncbi:MAG: RodZ domain-containing protein [Ideonella sp.]